MEYPSTCSIRIGRDCKSKLSFHCMASGGKQEETSVHTWELCGPPKSPSTYSAPPFPYSLLSYTSFYPQYIFTDSFYLSSHMSFAMYSTEARKEGCIPRNGISYKYLIRVQEAEFSSCGRVALLVGTTKTLI